jgi:hypothetical protein
MYNIVKIKKILSGKKNLVVIYLIAIVISLLMYCFCPRFDYFDISSYLFAKDRLLQNFKFDAFRPPLYPLFLAITYNSTGTIIAQNIIFFVSIGFFYSLLKEILSSSHLIFLLMLIYVQPTFIYYNYQLLTESLSISLCTIYLYFLVKYMVHEKAKDCWIFHGLMLILILIKPFFIFLLGISAGLFIYQVLFKRNIRRLRIYLLSMILSFSLIGIYVVELEKDHGVFGISCVSDINLYWIMKEYKLIDSESIETKELKSLVQGYSSDIYFFEAMNIYYIYGWKELHSIVQASMKKNYKLFLADGDILKFRLTNFNEMVGGSPIGNLWKAISFFCSVNFFQLSIILCIYFLWIAYSIFKMRKIAIISITFFVYIAVCFITIFFVSYDDYGRISVPMLSVSLLVIGQLLECMIDFIKTGKVSLAK